MRDFLRGVVQKYAARVERLSAKYQGKGAATSPAIEFAQARRFLPPNPDGLFLDIGGNRGAYSEEILKWKPEAHIAIYEPSETNQNLLNEKFKEHKNVVIYPLALSNQNSRQPLFGDHKGSPISSLHRRRLDHFGIEFTELEMVEVRTFESHWSEDLEKPEISFCKIDVEGFEFEVLEGFGEALSKCPLFQFEFGGTHIDTRYFFQDYWYFFREKGFDLFRITPLGVFQIRGYSESDEYFAGPTNILASRPLV